MDVADDAGTGEIEQVVVAPQLGAVIGEAFAAEILLGQPAGLDHRPHGAVEDEDSLRRDAAEEGGGGHGAALSAAGPRGRTPRMWQIA